MSGIALNGPFVVGYTLCFSFMGALAVQAYIYYTRFTDDRKAIKAFVTGILLLETLMTMLIFYGFWVPSTFQQFTAIDPILEALWLPPMFTVITGLVTTLSHGFYCWRILSLRKFRLISIPIMMVSLLQLASIVYLGAVAGFLPSNETLTNIPGSSPVQVSYSLSPWLVTWLLSSVVCDLTITICMILSLRPSQSHFGSNKSNLVKLTRFTIETGFVTTVTALLALILGTVYSQYMYQIPLFLVLSKLYANCLLATLNFRLVLRNQSDPNLTAIVWDDVTSNTQSRQLGPQSTHVVQILPQVGSDADMGNKLNEACSSENGSVEDQMCETYELPNGSMRV